MLGNRNPDEMQATGGYKSAKGGYKERVGAGGGGGVVLAGSRPLSSGRDLLGGFDVFYGPCRPPSRWPLQEC